MTGPRKRRNVFVVIFITVILTLTCSLAMTAELSEEKATGEVKADKISCSGLPDY